MMNDKATTPRWRARRKHGRSVLVVAAICAPLVLNVSGSSAQAAVSSTTVSRANTARACQALVTLDKFGDQGPASEQGPPPTSAQVKQYAGHMVTLIDKFVAVAPPGPKAPAERALANFRKAAKSGNVNLIDPGQSPMLGSDINHVERWVHEACGFEALDVIGVDYAYRGVPATLDAGVVSIKFTNKSTHEENHEFTVLRIKPGTGLDPATLVAAIKANPGKAQRTYGRDVVGVADAEAAPGQTGFTTVTLTRGNYVAACFIGNPAHATKGMITSFNVR